VTRSGAAAGRSGYVHEAYFYDSDDGLLEVVVPFLLEGLQVGEPMIVALGERKSALVRDALGDTGRIAFQDVDDHYQRPAAAIAAYRKLFGSRVAEGAGQIRAVGELPPPSTEVPWQEWARYEAVINHAYDEFPVWGICPYDVRAVGEDLLAAAMCTHPDVRTSHEAQHVNDHFCDPEEYLLDRAPRPAVRPDPLERTPAAIELVEPTPAVARRAATDLARRARLHEDAVMGLVVSVSEAVTNALVHGRTPVGVRGWTAPGRVVIAVSDGGAGPADPFAGWMPARRPEGGLGLWIAHQLCDGVTMTADADGFTVRLVAED
jgi:anti-sigma regulatory factor (Ser/Thr protein kinase)